MRNRQKFALALGIAWGLACSPALAAVPLTLADSVEMALERNEAISIGKNDVSKAQWTLKYYRRGKAPKITWASSASRIGGRDYETNNLRHNLFGDSANAAYNNRFINDFRLQIPLYNLNMDRQIKSSRYGLNAADLTLENTKQTLRFQVIKGYYDVLMRQNQINVAQSAIDMSSERLRMIKDQYDEGTVAKSDLLTMEVELGDYKQQLNTAVDNKKSATETLKNLIGLPEGTQIETKDDFFYEPFDPSLEECLTYAAEHRPDLASAAYNVQRAKADLAAAKATNDPTLSGTATQYYDGNGGFQQNHSENWSIGLNLNWTLFDSSQNSARVHGAEADLKSAEARLSQIRRQVNLEVDNAYSQMVTAQENLKITKLSVEQAVENNSIAQIRYEEGVDTIINLTNAQEKLTRARTNYYNALYSYNLGMATLLKAMGVPVNLDAAKYVNAIKAGKSSPEAVQIANTTEYYPLPKEPLEYASEASKPAQTAAEPTQPTAAAKAGTTDGTKAETGATVAAEMANGAR